MDVQTVSAWASIPLGMAALTGGGRWAWQRWSSRSQREADQRHDWYGTPGREGVPPQPGVMARLAAFDGLAAQRGQQIDEIHASIGELHAGFARFDARLGRVEAELTPNGGKSLKDTANRTEALLRALAEANGVEVGTGGTH